MAYVYCHQPSVRRVLLLDGETRTKAYSFRDKATGLLFGDGGTATLVEKLEERDESAFSLNSDGSRGGSSSSSPVGTDIPARQHL